jgi:hypothetical protein
MNDGDDLDRRFSGKATVLAWIAGPVAYVAVLVRYPDYWAIATAVIFVIVSGFFTTRIVLSLESVWATIGLIPVFGTGWLVLIWLLLKLLT